MRLFTIGAIVAALLVARVAAAQTPSTGDDPLRHGAGWGAAIGAASMVVLVQQSTAWCRIGCEADGSAASALIPGAVIGALAGWIADKDAGKTRRDGQRFHARLGPTVMHTWSSSAFDADYVSGGISATLQPSPHVTFAFEYRHADAHLVPGPGVVPQAILDNTVLAATRNAGWRRAPHSRDVGGTLTELVGGRLPSFGRVSIELVGGLMVQKRESRDYYDAAQSGTYKVLNFASADFGYVYGSNVEIALTRGLTAVPAVRITRSRDTRTISAGGGLQWRF